MSLTLQPFSAICSTTVVAATSETDYINFDGISKADYIDAGTDVVVDYSGTKMTVTGSDWGNDWGGESKWQIQLKELIPVTKGEKYEVSFDITSEVARNVFIKLGDVDVDATVYAEENLALEAGVTKTYTVTTSSTVEIDNLMVLFALGDQNGNVDNTITVTNMYVKGENSGYVETPAYIYFDGIENADFMDGTDVAVSYIGTTMTATGSDWGSDWGDSSKWQIQLKELIPVTKGEKYEVSFDITSEVARDVFIKLGDVDVDSTVYAEEALTLEAGETKTYTATTSSTVEIDNLMVLFALGDQNGAVENTITVTNLYVKGEVSGYVVIEAAPEVPATPDEKGPEYDFSDTSGDVADPGKTKAGYELVWADEFDGNYGDANVDSETGLNLDYWEAELGDGTIAASNPGWGNAELQCYTGDATNVGVNEDLDGVEGGEGFLRITASYDEDGYKYETESSKKYTSARLRTTTDTETLFGTTYGYVEARISLPATKGAWPAFWMLPETTDIYGGWPVSGEIDIMESCGAFESGANNLAAGTLHRGAPAQVFSGSGHVELDSDTTYFHTYAVDWEPGKITWYYDGKKIHEEKNWKGMFSGDVDFLAYDAPFDQPFYILLNLAIDSGRFGGDANKATFQDDINMYVDYVRVYQKTEGYPDSVVRDESTGYADDWADFAGLNLTGEMSESAIAIPESGNMNAVEDAGNVDNSKWYLGYQSDATDATIEAVSNDSGNWTKIGIGTAGAQTYSVQLLGYFDIDPGYVYKVSYDAYAAGGMIDKTIGVSASKGSPFFTKYDGTAHNVTLSAEPVSKTFYVTSSEAYDHCRLEYNLGSVGTGDVYIGNVKVEIIDPEIYESEKDARSAAQNGDVIYNGSFNLGDNRLGYWTAGDGTTVVVPRYTTTALTSDDVSVIDVASTLNSFEAEAKANGGVKYYERRAQISAPAGKTPSIYQAGLPMNADDYTLKFEMYSDKATTVTAAIYTVDDSGKLGDKVAESKTTDYTEVGKIKEYKWTLTTSKDVSNAALVLTFGDGACVQIDDVALIGANQGKQVDKTPVDADSEWSANTAGSGVATINEAVIADGVVTVSGITSDAGAWYTPQIGSTQFETVAGTKYKVSAKIKLEGDSNNKVKYIVQNQGSWEVVQDIVEIDLAALGEADEEGFYTYETTFTCGGTYSNVAFNWGLGHSAANDATFMFKDLTMTVVDGSSSEETDDGSTSMNGSEEKPEDPTEPEDPVEPENPVEPEEEPFVAPNVDVSYRTHIQSKGWEAKEEDVKSWKKDGQVSGTTGIAKRLEGINILVNSEDSKVDLDLGIQYTTHCQTYGWLPWSADGDMSGTEGEAKRLEAIKIQLTGEHAEYYDVYYRVHAQSYGWLAWAKNGEAAGTAGYGKRLEGIQIVVVKKGESINEKMEGIDSKDTKAFVSKDGKTPVVSGADTPNVTYRTHVQTIGWQAWKYNGQMSGTTGLAKRLEGIEIELTNKDYEGGIAYTTHVQSIGWQNKSEDVSTWMQDGEMAGTSGKAKRLEAIRIALTGEMAEHYDIYYRVHAQSYGWLGWAKNGDEAGTAGYSKRLEGIQIVIVPKDGKAPSENYGGVTSKQTDAFIEKK